MTTGNRQAGILLHITSLPGPWGIGELGPHARRFAEKLKNMGQSLWQVLPLGPTGYADSPYSTLSTFAGNHLLISFDDLVEDGLLSGRILRDFPCLPEREVDYAKAIPVRMRVLGSVCRMFERRAAPPIKAAFEKFCRENAYWLEDYALFWALKQACDSKPWTAWPQELARRKPGALSAARRRFAGRIRHARILQFLFDRQWRRLRAHCHRRGIRIIGDLPIFVAHDSADVWAHPELFFVDCRGRLIVQAGVPPDYFSTTGQLWGNPLYRWETHRRTGYRWWIQRMRRMLHLVDIVRIDHFRGFQAYWEVPAAEKTAINGRWVPGPGAELFDVLLQELGRLPIIAEDLGIITPDVVALRERYGFPGMKIMQFGFGDEDGEEHRPDHYTENCVAYTGTHDNDTIIGWFSGRRRRGERRTRERIEEERRRALRYLHSDGSRINWDFIRVLMQSRAGTVIVPLQDVMGLGSEARMNYPGTVGGNWKWRFTWAMLTDRIAQQLYRLAVESGRAPPEGGRT
ncbi:MAG TPA: 4-alpha-glucanotransferase [Kiritimatiellae bacterium]|nr:4-alpha-glucanotransferase [Kiritimatiellia bacterium]